MHKLSDILSGALRGFASLCRRPYTCAIIVAAGSGIRMNNPDGVKKQHVEIMGVPIVVRSALEFQKCELIDEIIVVCAKDEIPLYSEYKKKYRLTKLTGAVSGGSTRAESALKGFYHLPDKCDYVCIHDAVRCLVTADIIKSVMQLAFQSGAAIAAAKCSDTIKRVSENGEISQTIDRSVLWKAQTPQAFKKSMYFVGVSKMKPETEYTDDSMIVEDAGFKVKIFDCGNDNIKITTPSDLIMAEAVLNNRNNKVAED